MKPIYEKPHSLLIVIVGLTINACKSPQLMKYSDFSKLKELNLPKVLTLDAEDKNLLYLGVYHSNDKNDSIFDFIQNRLEKFQPDYVFHDGGSNWPIYKDIDSTKLIDVFDLCDAMQNYHQFKNTVIGFNKWF